MSLPPGDLACTRRRAKPEDGWTLAEIHMHCRTCRTGKPGEGTRPSRAVTTDA
ncbi:MAG: hypothetical protein AAGE38_08890 [Pseudomonadota bacterium]